MVERPPVELREYVDVEDALKRVCGNQSIYKRLLGKFKDSLLMEELRQKFSAGELEEAAKIAHSIKGVTANLSLPAAYEKCVEVEASLKQGAANEDDIEKLGEILKTTVLCTDYLIETL